MNVLAKHREYKYSELLALTTLIWIAIWLYRLFSGSLLHDISKAAVFDLWLDRSFWIMFLSNIPQTIISHTLLCLLFDGLVLVLPILFLFFRKRILLIGFLISYLLFSFTYEAYGFFHSKTSIAPLLAFIPFLAKKDSFDLLFKGVRYYLVFIMVSAGLYKIINGAFFDFTYISSILPQQHLLAFAENESTRFISFLIQHPSIAAGIYIGGTIIELFFITACFTYKFDRLLLLFLVGFSIISYAVFRIENVLILILGVSLLYERYNR
jgi:hypothetical protein